MMSQLPQNDGRIEKDFELGKLVLVLKQYKRESVYEWDRGRERERERERGRERERKRERERERESLVY
jgi:hypothetical protein